MSKRSVYAIECCRCSKTASVHVREVTVHGSQLTQHYCRTHGEGAFDVEKKADGEMRPVFWFYGTRGDDLERVEKLNARDWRLEVIADTLAAIGDDA